MSINIYDLANELERGIRQLPEYQEVSLAKKAIDADADAKKLWEEFVAFQTRLQQMMETGQVPSEDDQNTMMALGQRLEANPQVKAYFDHQQRLSIYISDIEKIIFQPLKDLV